MAPPAIKKERSRSKESKEEKKMEKRNTSSSSSSSSSSERKMKKKTGGFLPASQANKRKMERKTESTFEESRVLALENLADSLDGLVSKATIAKLVIKLMMETLMQIQMVMLTTKVMWTKLSVAVGVAITVFFAFNNKGTGLDISPK